MVIIVLSQVLKNNLVPDYNLRDQNLSGGRGGMPPDPLVGTHTYACERAFACCYHPAINPVFPSKLKILYETVLTPPIVGKHGHVRGGKQFKTVARLNSIISQ